MESITFLKLVYKPRISMESITYWVLGLPDTRAMKFDWHFVGIWRARHEGFELATSIFAGAWTSRHEGDELSTSTLSKSEQSATRASN